MPTRTPHNSDDDTPKTMFEWQLRSINNPELGESWPMSSSPGGWKDWEADFDRAVNDAC